MPLFFWRKTHNYQDGERMNIIREDFRVLLDTEYAEQFEGYTRTEILQWYKFRNAAFRQKLTTIYGNARTAFLEKYPASKVQDRNLENMFRQQIGKKFLVFSHRIRLFA